MKFTKIRKVKSPVREFDNDSGIDFYIPEDFWKIKILPWDNITIPLWLKIILPEWKDLTFVNKSWIASKTWLIVWACLIDWWYRWELQVNLINTSKFEVELKKEQKIVQWVIRDVSYEQPEEIEEDDYFIATEDEEWKWRFDWWFWSTWIN